MNPLRIVHCANFSESKNGAVYYAVDRKLSNGFVRNGHYVYDFSYRELAKNATIFKSKKFGVKHVNRALLDTLCNVEPDLLLLGHSELITDDTLRIARHRHPDLKIAMWWVDAFIRSPHILSRLAFIDAFFATTGNDCLINMFGANTAATCQYFPNVCDASIEYAVAEDDSGYAYDLLYVGRDDDNRKPFIEYVKSLQHIKFGLFGNDRNTLIHGAQYYRTLKQAKIGLNYSRYNDIELYSSDRIIQLVSSGIMVMSPEIPGFRRLFDDTEIVYFSTNDDFRDKLDFYLKNDDLRLEIAAKGYQKAISAYNSTRTAKFMIESIYDLGYSEEYEWL